MFVLALLVILLNFFDAVFTQAGLAHGIVIEVNPLLAILYHLNPTITFVSKLVLIPLGVGFVAINGEERVWVFYGLIFCVVVYLVAFGLHLLWLGQFFLLMKA